MENVKNKLLLFINQHIKSIRDTIHQELLDFYLKHYKSESPEDDPRFIKVKAEETADEVMRKIHVPKTSNLLANMKLKYFFSELTWEDLTNKDFQEEMSKFGLIDKKAKEGLAKFSKGVEGKQGELFIK